MSGVDVPSQTLMNVVEYRVLEVYKSIYRL